MTINKSLDDIFALTNAGSVDYSYGNIFYGLNHQQTPNMVPLNTDHHGFTFFVRPQLNFTNQNLRSDSRFTPLLTKNINSLQRIIRCTLDPRLAVVGGISTPFVDPRQSFIPILSEHLETLTGFPDIVLDTHQTKPDQYKSTQTIVDSNIAQGKSFDITTTFRNMPGSPIVLMMHYWMLYTTLVFDNTFSPYPDFIIDNELDYNTRIYRLVLDPSKRYVEHIGCTVASFPISTPYGNIFNYNRTEPYNMENKSFSVVFSCDGYKYNEPSIIGNFNDTVKIFNGSMKMKSIESQMVKLKDEERLYFKNRGYPRIDPKTKKLDWYVSKELYSKIMNQYSSDDFELPTDNVGFQ